MHILYVCTITVVTRWFIPSDDMEIMSLDFNHSVPLLNNITVLCCSVAPPPGSYGNQYADSKCVVMVMVVNSNYLQMKRINHMFLLMPTSLLMSWTIVWSSELTWAAKGGWGKFITSISH